VGFIGEKTLVRKSPQEGLRNQKRRSLRKDLERMGENSGEGRDPQKRGPEKGSLLMSISSSSMRFLKVSEGKRRRRTQNIVERRASETFLRKEHILLHRRGGVMDWFFRDRKGGSQERLESGSRDPFRF